MKKKRIAIVVPGIHLGGGVPSVANFIVNTIKNDNRWDYKIISLCMSSNDPESGSLFRFQRLLRKPKVGTRNWQGLEVPHVGAFCGEIEFQRYMKRKALTKLISDCDIIQVICGTPAWANTVINLGKPVSLQVATLVRKERYMRDKKKKNIVDVWRSIMTNITDRLDIKALRSVNAIQTENNIMQDTVSKILAEKHNVDIKYAPPGIDVNLFKPKKTRNVDDGYVLCVGRLCDPRKNIGLLLEAYSMLPDHLINKHMLLLAGSSGPTSEFYIRAEKLGISSRIKFLHFPSEKQLIELYQDASIFVLPSDEEGLGVVVLESMSCGVPTICTRSGGPDSIITDGHDGYLVPKNDAESLKEAMQKLISNHEKNIIYGQNARQTIESKYSMEIAGKAFVKIWENLTTNNN